MALSNRFGLFGYFRIVSRKLALFSCPKHMKSSPVHVTLTRLQDSQKLWVRGVINPIFCYVSLTFTYRAGPPVFSSRS